MIDHLYKQWNIKQQHIVSDQFTGYESVYNQLDSYTKEQYNKDPQAVINEVSTVNDIAANPDLKFLWFRVAQYSAAIC